jgi:ribosomal protein S18 acetylase RimI-like enzyme
MEAVGAAGMVDDQWDSMAEPRFEPEPVDSALARGLLDRYYSELAARFPGGAGAFELANIAAPTTEFAPPQGVFLIARLDGRAVGCGAVRTLGAGHAEIKRMWVDPAARGLGVGRGLLGALEGAAVERGFRSVRLDTAAYLVEALALYLSAGYREVPAYNDNPYAAHWLEKRLS